MMRYLSVCSGIEAASVAWDGLMGPLAFSEIEKFPSAVLESRFPSVPNLGDMNQFKEWNFDKAIDVLVGGTPCQSFSVAGLRKGLADPRGNLALVYCGILERFQPRWFVWENVPGVLSSNRGRDFGAFLGAVAQLGYGFAYRVLDAQFFGVPQRRRRVFVVGCLGGWRRSAAVLFERESLCRNPKKGGSEKQEIARALRGRANSSHREDSDNFVPMTAHACLAKGQRLDPTCETFVTGSICANGKAAGSATSQDAESGLLVACTLPASDGGVSSGMHPVVAFNASQDPDYWTERTGPIDTDGCTQALAISGRARGDDGRGYSRPEHISEIAGTVDATKPDRVLTPSMAVRRLTPLECERLQGFPDNWTAIQYRGKPAADGPRYKAIGNSMAVPVMRWIGQRLCAVEVQS